jgi:hypothetical protein
MAIGTRWHWTGKHDLGGSDSVPKYGEEEEAALNWEDRMTAKSMSWWHSAAPARLCPGWGHAMRRW